MINDFRFRKKKIPISATGGGGFPIGVINLGDPTTWLQPITDPISRWLTPITTGPKTNPGKYLTPVTTGPLHGKDHGVDCHGMPLTDQEAKMFHCKPGSWTKPTSGGGGNGGGNGNDQLLEELLALLGAQSGGIGGGSLGGGGAIPYDTGGGATDPNASQSSGSDAWVYILLAAGAGIGIIYYIRLHHEKKKEKE